jgi:hypothetical protein
MQEAALRAATPAPPSDTARAFADLGAACGGCHEASGVKPQIVLSDPPKASEDVQPHMVGHLWAVRAMWIGLVTNDADVWVRGATHLSGDPLHGEAFEIGEMPEHLLEFAKSVHANGAKAGDAKDTKARLEAFTGVVQSCGDCHLEMRGE